MTPTTPYSLPLRVGVIGAGRLGAVCPAAPELPALFDALTERTRTLARAEVLA